MTDIHCHILYGLDDGADSLEEAVEMAQVAYEGGTRTIIATPHSNVTGSYRNLWSEEFDIMLRSLNDSLKEKKIDVSVLPGQEIFCEDNVPELLARNKLITLNHSRYPLVEFDFYERSSSVIRKLEMLVAEGLSPIVAHPERYAFVNEDESSLFRIKQLGCFLQINKGSLGGNFGKHALRTAHFILDNSLADFIASDAHSPYSRTPYLETAFEYVAENFSFDYAELLFDENPRAAAENKEVSEY